VDTGFPRRRFLAASAIAASGLVLAGSKPRTVFAAERQQESTNDEELPEGVVVLRVADVTQTMENVVLQVTHFCTQFAYAGMPPVYMRSETWKGEGGREGEREERREGWTYPASSA